MHIRNLKLIVNQVHFDTDYGSAFGVWDTKHPLPDLSGSIEIELDVIDDLEWLKNVTPSLNQEYSIQVQEGGDIIISGMIVDTGSDGCSVMEVGESILLVDIINIPDNYTGMVDVHCRNITITPVYY